MHEREAIAKLVFRLIVAEIVERLQHQSLEDHDFIPRLVSRQTLARRIARAKLALDQAFSSTGTIRREPSQQSLRADHSFRRDFHSVGSNRRSQAVPCQHPASESRSFESDSRGGWKGEFFEVPITSFRA